MYKNVSIYTVGSHLMLSIGFVTLSETTCNKTGFTIGLLI